MSGPLRYSLLLSLCLAGISAFGQGNIGALFKSNVELGDELFKDLYFERAAEYYAIELKKNQDPGVMLKLANALRAADRLDEAIDWYGKAFETDPLAGSTEDRYNYAECLLSSGKMDEALTWYEKYAQMESDDPRPAEKVSGIKAYDLFYRDSSIYLVHELPFNSQYSDFGAVSMGNDVVYSSARGVNSFIDPDYLREEDLMELYEVGTDTSGWSHPTIFARELSSQLHEGPVVFFNEGEAMILTQSNRVGKKAAASADGSTKPQLYSARKNGDLWSIEGKLPINDPDHSFAHPSLSLSGDTLYFSSDIPEGYGGNDIYMSIRLDGTWSEPANLGPAINTRGDEMYPFIVKNRLYFSSNGHMGMGGLDMYKAILSNGNVVGIQNLGYPLNSRSDDFAYTIDPQTLKGFFTSDRAGGRGSDDIYSLEKTAHVLKGKALTTQDKSAIADAIIRLFSNGELLDEVLTDSEGNFHFYLPLSEDFEIEAEKEGYTFEDRVSLTTNGNPVDVDSIFISLRLQDLFIRGIVYDSRTQEGLEKSTVFLYDRSNSKVDSTTTDQEGKYSFPISPQREFSMVATKYHYFPDSLQFTSFGIEKGEILNDFILDEVYVDKEVIYFEFDSDVLRIADRPVLDKVLQLLKEYPEDYLIIGAHADARGTREYNQELSDRRAASTRQFFIDRGVDPSRIHARGFGEAFIINRCTDGANCMEEDHSQNRRTEMTVAAELEDN